MRMSCALACLTLSVCFAAQSLGLLPDAERPVLAGRRALCEAVAIQCALAAQKDDQSTLHTVIQALVLRNKDVLSAAVRRTNGKLLALAGNHAGDWALRKSETSTPDQVVIPIRQGKLAWGRVEIGFVPLEDTSWAGRLWGPGTRLLVFVTLSVFLAYAWYLKRTLTHLDPAAVIPERVRATLDTLAEGVLVIDRNQRIVLANKAFAHNTGQNPESLQGRRAEDIAWHMRDSDAAPQDFPWTRAIREGTSQTGVMLRLSQNSTSTRTFMVNTMPIVGSDGRQRGALATFDDVTSIEKKNQQLEEMLTVLNDSRDEIHRKNEELTLLATRDPLTACLNRRAFYNLFETHWNATRKNNQALSCVMVDVDHFKAVNDTHGHSVGDQVLQDVSSILRAGARPTDVVCRYGGEEFCVLLPQTGLSEARVFAERLRRQIAEKQCGPIYVTASLGVSAMDLGASDPRELLDQADKSLYVSKRSGRNRVTLWSEVPADFAIELAESGRKQRGEDFEVDVPIPFHAVTALSSALAYRDALTAEHSRRVADLCVATAQGMMPERQCYVLEVAALLHDIGKLGVPDAILLKPGPLTADEWKVMRTHDRIGVEIISAAFSSPELTEIVRTHHAFYGGSVSALPCGEDIPLGARILTIADAYDAMVSDRVYRKGRDRDQAFVELRRCAGSQFDPAVVERFIEAVSSNDQSRNQPPLAVTKPTALRIGIQIERLATAIDAKDYAALSVMAGRLAATASKDGVMPIAELASELERCAQSEPDLIEIVSLTTNLLELCRATQASYIAVDPAVEMAEEDEE